MALASRGLRDMGEGLERLDQAEREQVRRQARRVHQRALAAAVAYAAAAYLLP